MNKNVFINCPFDESYNSKLCCILFLLITLDYIPRLSLECSDAGKSRLEKIIFLISESRISIHDLSKVKLEAEGEYSRMNMPFELGLDFGCRNYSNDKEKSEKKFCVLGGIKYEYMKALSDISGIDIMYHEDDEIKLITQIRNWFVTNESLLEIPKPTQIWYKYNDFQMFYVEKLKENGYSDEEIYGEEIYSMPIREQIAYMRKFLKEQPYQ